MSLYLLLTSPSKLLWPLSHLLSLFIFLYLQSDSQSSTSSKSGPWRKVTVLALVILFKRFNSFIFLTLSLTHGL